MRDRRCAEQLFALGWSCVVIWECEIRDAGQLDRIIAERIGVRPDSTGRAAGKKDERRHAPRHHARAD